MLNVYHNPLYTDVKNDNGFLVARVWSKTDGCLVKVFATGREDKVDNAQEALDFIKKELA